MRHVTKRIMVLHRRRSWSATPVFRAAPGSVTTISYHMRVYVASQLRPPRGKKAASARKSSDLALWVRIIARGESLPAEVLAMLPTDGAREHDHYIYGAPKRDG